MDTAFKKDGVLHAAIFLAAWGAASFGMSALGWPWHLLLPLLAYALIVLAWPRLRRTAPRLAVGRVGGWPLVATAALGLATSVVLVEYHLLRAPEVAELAAAMPARAFGNLLVAGIWFSVRNAALEELVFRGVLWEFVAAEWNGRAALAATTVLFGLGHLHGYPSGLLGVILAGVF